MSISSEISRISGNVSNAYTAINDMGGTVPSSANSGNLATAIRSIPQSGGTSDVFWVEGDLDLTTLSIDNLDSTYSDILSEYEAEKIVKLKLSYYLAPSVSAEVIGELRGYSPDVNVLVFDILVTADMGSGVQVFYFMINLSSNDSIVVQPYLLNSTSLS